MNRPTCGSCYYWQQLPNNHERGICKRYPPGPPHEIETGLPQDEWCGEHRALGGARIASVEAGPRPEPEPEPKTGLEPEDPGVEELKRGPRPGQAHQPLIVPTGKPYRDPAPTSPGPTKDVPPTPKADPKAEPINPGDKTPAEKKKHARGRR